MNVTHRCAVLGSPIAHSLSPQLHRAAYAALGLTGWSYDRFEVAEAGLAGFVAGLDDSWRGLSLTKPLKAAAVALGEPDEQVRLAGAANTVIVEPDGRRRLFNTDIGGLTRALRAAGLDTVGRVAILGAGGTTRAALVSVAALGATQVQVLARRPEQLAELRPLADRLELRLVGGDWSDPVGPAELLISTVTAEAVAARVDVVGPADTGAETGFGAVFDAVYDPWPTPLAAAAADRGATVISGLDLLAHQAVGQVELMTGRSVDPGLLLAAGRAALDRRDRRDPS